MMKKNVAISILTIWMIGMASMPIFACEISFSPEKFETLALGSVVTVEVIVTKEHRRCPLDDDDVIIELSGQAEIVNQTAWKARGRKEIVSTFDIKMLHAGLTTFRIVRECQKKGTSEAVLTFETK